MNKILSIIGLFLITSLGLFALSDIDNAKIIYLCGENHINDQDINFKEYIRYHANQGHLVYANEATLRHPEAENKFMKSLGYTRGIYGIEDPLFFTFMQTVGAAVYRDTFESSDSFESDLLYLLISKSTQPFLNDFWKNEDLTNNPIFQFLKKNKNTLSKKPMQLQQKLFINKINKFSNSDWIDFSRQLALTLEPMVAKQIPTKKRKTLEFLMTCCLDGLKLENLPNLQARLDFVT